VLAVDRLTVYRGNYAAVQDISFSLRAGSAMAIVGPNGAGKSTLIQAVLGLLPRRAGDITLLGQPLGRAGYRLAALHQQIAYLPQNFQFDRRIPMTVADVVGLGWDRLGFQFPWSDAGDRRTAVEAALTRVGAAHLYGQSISGLSGGETKRILLAYCLVRPRKLLILDEAPAGLDLRGESDFYHLLDQLKQEEGWAILQISHDLDMVKQHCDCVLCMNRNLFRQGSPDEVLSADILSAAYGSPPQRRW
jgi:zinc/manganese transport system ATP-binding protein